MEDWDAYSERSDKAAWLAQRKVRVIAPQQIRNPPTTDSKGNIDWEATARSDPQGCPKEFPIKGIENGVYYLPGDELYDNIFVYIGLALCFAGEEDAIRAGYVRGPH